MVEWLTFLFFILQVLISILVQNAGYTGKEFVMFLSFFTQMLEQSKIHHGGFFLPLPNSSFQVILPLHNLPY
jgi:hypothetical protein